MYDCHDGWDGAFWDVALSELGVVHDSLWGKARRRWACALEEGISGALRGLGSSSATGCAELLGEGPVFVVEQGEERDVCADSPSCRTIGVKGHMTREEERGYILDDSQITMMRSSTT